MSQTTTQLDVGKVIEWIKRYWFILLVALIVLMIVMRMSGFGGRRRIIIE